MPKKLTTDKIKLLQAKIARERNDLKYSLEDAAQNLSNVKKSAAEIGRNPLLLLVPEDSIFNKESVTDIVKEKPLQTVAACFSAGLLTSYLIRKIRPDWKKLASQTAKYVAASEVTEKIKDKLSDISGEFIENIFSDNNSEKEDFNQVNDDFSVLH